MKMIFRWFGSDNDNIPLKYIRQIPAVSGVVTALYDIPAGEIWPSERIMAVKKDINSYGLKMEVIESVNVHEDIKLGSLTRDRYIENYIETIKNLSKAGVKCICYNFMPVFDWTRTDLAYTIADGSKALFYKKSVIDSIQNPLNMIKEMQQKSNGFIMPGWEPERLGSIGRLFDEYKSVNEEKLFDNLKYFLQAIIPVCEKYGVKMAIHPDDPPWAIFGLPRIITCENNIERMLGLVDNPYNGLTLCSGSLGANRQNDIPKLILHFGKKNRIHFAHIRNIKFYENGDFSESSHLSSDGSLDMYQIMKAYFEIGFNGYVRPDHGRTIWDENARPGYGLYDRALGIAYLNGLYEAILKENS